MWPGLIYQTHIKQLILQMVNKSLWYKSNTNQGYGLHACYFQVTKKKKEAGPGHLGHSQAQCVMGGGGGGVIVPPSRKGPKLESEVQLFLVSFFLLLFFLSKVTLILPYWLTGCKKPSYLLSQVSGLKKKKREKKKKIPAPSLNSGKHGTAQNNTGEW